MQSELLDLKMVPYSRRQDQQMRNNHDNDNDDDKSQSGGNDYETPDVKPTIIDRGRFMAEPIIVAKPASAAVGGGGGGGKVLIRYRECMRNHAASIGGHANDGCGEFMQGIEGLRCAACGCHRNFHRKEIQCGGGGGGGRDGHIRHLQPPPPPPPLGGARWEKEKKKTGGGFPSLSSIALPQFSNGNNGRGVDLGLNNQSSDDGRSETPEEIRSGGGGGGGGNKLSSSNSSNKRFRTKFSQEQKEKMLEFAEKLGWRIQKQDDFAISQFCLQVGVKRQVLKVWMHNNKITYKKRESIGNAPPPQPPLQGHPPPPLPEMDTESPPSSDSAPPLPPPPSHQPINNHIE